MQYGLIGEKLGHSFSKEIHEQLADYLYELCPLTREEFPRFMERADFRAINVTIPYKEMVIPYLAGLDEQAQAIGAVNTIVNRGGRLYGHNTDFAGFAYLLARHNISLAGKKVLILGGGGTSKTVRAVAEAQGAAEVIRSDRTVKPGLITYAEAQNYTQAEVIINATPCGMFPANQDKPLVDLTAYPNLCAVADVVYNPLKTNLVLAAEALGLPACGGLEMLVAQAKYAAEYFTGQAIPDSEIERIYQGILPQKQNIALIGMPGSGKTTVGSLLAERLRLPLVDCDTEVEKRAGKPIKAIFAEEGEAAFRTLETAVMQDIAAQGGQIIATGGGAILKAENLQALRQNSLLVFLDKQPQTLALDDTRPLSPDMAANLRLYQQRYPKYLAAADITIDNNGTAGQAADAIIQRSGY